MSFPLPDPEQLRELGVSEEDIRRLDQSFRNRMQEMIKRAASDNERLTDEQANDIKGFLSIMHGEYRRANKFKVGDFVVWKGGMKNKRLPRYNEPAVVMEVLDPPMMSPNEESGSPYFRENLSLALGFIDLDGEFVVFHFDGARFDKYE